ncbi:MAG: DUF2961 domain-containing protein [Deinococcus sp.]|nr:DUF2961 domain-containing protein [Deinococcus sp.]
MGLAKGLPGGPLADLARLRHCRRKRLSSYDRTGGNLDRITIAPGETAVLGEIVGAGCITHIWFTTDSKEQYHLRKAVLRMYWDGEKRPSVEVPLGDFFGLGHAETKNFVSLPLVMAPRDGKALNCFFPMPFSQSARIEVQSELAEHELILYYYIDYEEYDELEENLGRFHAQWRRVNPTKGVDVNSMTPYEFAFSGKNLTGKDNYVILEARGHGHYVGCTLYIHNLLRIHDTNWYGEGDDMIFIDGEQWPPSLHGTGTEDYFCTAWSPLEEFCSPFFGIPMAGGKNWSGKISLYRFHIADPITFHQSIRVTIEHGHDNHRSDDIASVAYWYQAEPHQPFPRLPPVARRLPRPE